MHTFYHGSPVAGLKTLRAGSFVTPDLETARLMGRFYTNTGKTWSDDDLEEKHIFGQQPKWKAGREPDGVPNIYQVTTDTLDDIDLLNNPYEHTLKKDMAVALYDDKLRAAITQAVKTATTPVLSSLTNMANSAIQHPLGQTALGHVAGAYNTFMPQAGKDMVRDMVPNYASPEMMQTLGMQGKWQPEPFTDKSFELGTHVASESVLNKTTTNGQHAKQLSNRVQTAAPVEVTGTPLQQIGYGLSGGVMPGQTFKPGTQAYNTQNLSYTYDSAKDTGINKQLTHSLTPTVPEFQKQNSLRLVIKEVVASASSAASNDLCHFGRKQADLQPWVQLQPHQQRVADRISGPNPRMLVYHGLGTGKSLAAIAAAEAAKKNSGGDYAIVAPASLRDNFRKEIDKFTTGSNPEILSYTGLGMGQHPKNNPETLIFDEAHRLRNPEGLASLAAVEAAKQAPRVALLTGSPITNHPTDLANLLSILRNEKITPEKFEEKFIDYKKVKPGWGGWLRGVKPGEEVEVKNPEGLKSLLRGRVDYNPGKSPEGVDINEQIVDAPLTAEQEKIQKALRTKIPPRFLWKLDKEFPLSREELGKLNSFLTGMRQVSLSTQPFRADGDYFKAFEQSGKLQTALSKLRETLDSDPRRKALIYSNYIDAGLQPYAAALAKNNIPHAIFHGGIPLAARRKALEDYNAGKLRALLIGPAGAEGISTKGTSLIQLLDPHWNETRSQQAQGRGLRFDSHRDLPEELKNVAIQRFISRAKQPGWFRRKILGAKPERTGDEILDTLAKAKEKANDKFRAILKQVGTESQQEEMARQLYEEEGPARKAASLAWAKMAATH